MFALFSSLINIFLDEHAPIDKLSKKWKKPWFSKNIQSLDEHAQIDKLSKKSKKPWFSKNIQSLMRERDKLSYFYYQKTDSTANLTKHNNI